MKIIRLDCALWIVCFLAFEGATGFAASPPKVVFAHYMLANQDYAVRDADSEQVIAAYQREIRQAQAIGIDGFALNAGGWFKEPRYIRRASEIFEAAYRLHSNFKFIFSADMCCSNDAADVEDMMRRFANNKRYSALYYKWNGRFVLTTFSGDALGSGFWLNLRNDLEKGANPSRLRAPEALSYAGGIPSSAPLPVYLIPAFFWGGELPRAKDIEAGLAEYGNVIDGAFYWGIAGVPGLGRVPDQVPSSDAYADVLHRASKLYMAPICLQFWGANAGRYYEYGGFAGMRALWRNAIEVTHPEWIEIITWNDFIEGTYVSPIDDPAKNNRRNDLDASIAPPATLRFFPSHAGAGELLAYFIQWYKTGVQQKIKRDSVYWAYRMQLTPQSAAHANRIKIFGEMENVLYLTANLTAPAELRVTFGAESKAVALPAGSHDLKIPMIAGAAPRFELMRGKVILAQSSGEDEIRAQGEYPDYYYSTGAMHD